MLLSNFVRYYCLRYIIPRILHITEELIFYADKIMVMANSKNSSVFNFAILLKSRKFDAREIYMFYSIRVGRSEELFNTRAVLGTQTC